MLLPRNEERRKRCEPAHCSAWAVRSKLPRENHVPRSCLLALGILFSAAAPALAQDESRAEVSAGWRFYHATISSITNPITLPRPNDYPMGWYADVAVNVSEKFAIVGEAGGTYHTDESDRTSGTVRFQERYDATFYTFMGGIRVRAPQNAAFVPFGQVLFGGEHDTSELERVTTFNQNTTRSAQERSTSSPVLALDGGITISAGRIGVRTSVGYARFFSTADSDALRVNVGGTVRF